MQLMRGFKSEIFKALANPLRIAILDALRDGERGVGDLATVVSAELPAVSQQLAILRGKNLVRFRKQGSFAYYQATDPLIFGLLDDAARIFRNHLIDLQGAIEALPEEVES